MKYSVELLGYETQITNFGLIDDGLMPFAYIPPVRFYVNAINSKKFTAVMFD